MSKVTVMLPNGKKFEHDFDCNDYYAEMFHIVREIFELDLRAKWFKNLKNEFWGIQCFGNASESPLLSKILKEKK